MYEEKDFDLGALPFMPLHHNLSACELNMDSKVKRNVSNSAISANSGKENETVILTSTTIP